MQKCCWCHYHQKPLYPTQIGTNFCDNHVYFSYVRVQILLFFLKLTDPTGDIVIQDGCHGYLLCVILRYM